MRWRKSNCIVEGLQARGWRTASCIILQGISALQIWGASFCGLEEAQPRKIRGGGAKFAINYGCITLRAGVQEEAMG